MAALLGAAAMTLAACGGSEVEIEIEAVSATETAMVSASSPTAGGAPATDSVSTVDSEEGEARLTAPAETPAPVAVVEGVSVSGDPRSCTFKVTICRPQTGCEQYAD